MPLIGRLKEAVLRTGAYKRSSPGCRLRHSFEAILAERPSLAIYDYGNTGDQVGGRRYNRHANERRQPLRTPHATRSSSTSTKPYAEQRLHGIWMED